MTRFVYDVQMRWTDMDALQHVNNAAYITYVEQARVAMFFDYSQRAEIGLTEGVVVAKHDIEYLRPVTYHPEPLRIELWVSQVRGASLTVVQEVYDGEPLVASITTVLVRFDFTAGMPKRISAQEREILAEYADDAIA